MREELICCIKKDIKEVLRTGKLITMFALAFGIALMILGFTLFFSDIPEELWSQLTAFNIESLEDVIGSLYPRLARESTGIFAYYIGFFFSLVVVLMCFNILPKERDAGKWVIPLQQGYEKGDIIISKCLVYGLTGAVSVFTSYIFYYIMANIFMERNFPLGNALVCAVVHSLNLCLIIVYTMVFSMVYKNPVISALSMLATVILVPDFARYFSFGKLLPTHLLSFAYDSSNSYQELAAPIIVNICIFILIYLCKDILFKDREK
ncbi:MAG: hypothetical protein J5842_03925 [Lachnospiraceae bacterium]|nr:hypothetical protein [Lachnospiraceae bacterium]